MAPAADAADGSSGRPEPPVVVIAPPPPSPAPLEESLPPASEPRARPRSGLEVSIGGGFFPAALGDVQFTGSGVPIGTSRRVGFAHRGRELGLANPSFLGGELAVGYRHAYFGIFVSGFLANGRGTDVTPADARAAEQVAAGRLTAYGGALELVGSVPLGRLTVSAGALAGLRGFSLPLQGFEAKTCTSSSRHGRRRTYPCPETATTMAQAYVQPRLRLDVTLDEKQSVFVGGYVGIDALGDRSVLGGIVLGIRLLGPGS